MILIEVRYTAEESAFMTLESEMDGPLDDSELYWLTISNKLRDIAETERDRNRSTK